jgi:hypothetical protein
MIGVFVWRGSGDNVLGQYIGYGKQLENGIDGDLRCFDGKCHEDGIKD